MKENKWYFYVLLCSDGSYYAGVTTNMDRRLKEHNNSARGAKYTRARRPVKVLTTTRYLTRSLAQKAEAQFKKLTRKEKDRVINESKDDQ